MIETSLLCVEIIFASEDYRGGYSKFGGSKISCWLSMSNRLQWMVPLPTCVLVAIAMSDGDIGLLGHDFFGNYDVTLKQNVVEFRRR